jgi:hypothetical protein
MNSSNSSKMSNKIIEIVNRDFDKSQQERVLQELSSIGLEHVMAESEYNLENTRRSILKLAKGDLNQVITLTKAAKKDFRDVIFWATQDKG